VSLMLHALVQAVRRRLAEQADPAKAGPMQAYMKSTMPFRGVPGPAQKALWKELLDTHALASRREWTQVVRQLWQTAQFREERYAAVALVSHRSYLGYRTAEALPLLDEMIVTGAWWDFVDALATHPLADVLKAETTRGRGRAIRRRLEGWARGSDLWKRRAAILCQIGAGAEIDAEFLYRCIGPNLLDAEPSRQRDLRDDFFIRKAIGWALRQYARVAPDDVRRYVRANQTRLSPLSRREALKALQPRALAFSKTSSFRLPAR